MRWGKIASQVAKLTIKKLAGPVPKNSSVSVLLLTTRHLVGVVVVVGHRQIWKVMAAAAEAEVMVDWRWSTVQSDSLAAVGGGVVHVCDDALAALWTHKPCAL